MELDRSSLVAVADGGRARLFEERRRGGPLHEITDRLRDLHDRLPPRGAGGGGGVHDRMGRSSHVGDSPGLQARREAALLRRLAQRIDALMVGGGYDDLVVIAPPRALGEIREGLLRRPTHTEARDRVRDSAEALRRRLAQIRAG